MVAGYNNVPNLRMTTEESEKPFRVGFRQESVGVVKQSFESRKFKVGGKKSIGEVAEYGLSFNPFAALFLDVDAVGFRDCDILIVNPPVKKYESRPQTSNATVQLTP